MIMKHCDNSFFEIFLDRWRNFDTFVNLENHFKSKEWCKRWEAQEDVLFDIIQGANQFDIYDKQYILYEQRILNWTSCLSIVKIK